MGDKGGKKNKEKSQKQSSEKQKQKEKNKTDKQPKTKLSGTLAVADGIFHTPVTDHTNESNARIAVHEDQMESVYLLKLPATWRIDELSVHFLRPPH